MYRFILSLILIFCFCGEALSDDTYQTIPVAYQGRFVPLDVYARLTLKEFYGKEQIKKSHLAQFDLQDSSALTFFLYYYFLGSKHFDEAPLFQIHYAELKNQLGLDPEKMHFSYKELQKALQRVKNFDPALMPKPHSDEAAKLIFLMREYQNSKGVRAELIADANKPQLSQLQNFSSLFSALPAKKSNSWISLQALKMKMEDPNTKTQKLINNFTTYPDKDFQAIREAYFSLESAVLAKNHHLIEASLKQLSQAIKPPYKGIANTPALQAFQKTYLYPTPLQLESEFYYYQIPFIEIAMLFYTLALIGFLINRALKKKLMNNINFLFLGMAFFLHTFVLALRCFILQRPPVSNMFETVIYVPWIAMIAGFLFFYYTRFKALLVSSCFGALGLLILLEVTDLNTQLENPQAVLDSQYWLTVHVMMIVGSYGVFFLSAILGHYYLSLSFFNKTETNEMKLIGNSVLQTMYLGVSLLIPGTILGGVWAAESWGRFWDWDPKESWAFISCCIYLIFIHAFRFHKIKAFGLSIGSALGFMAISFTWYGVNYILGTGLHSYGFGSGGEIYYYLFLILELFFLMSIVYKHKNIVEQKNG